MDGKKKPGKKSTFKKLAIPDASPSERSDSESRRKLLAAKKKDKKP